MDPLLGSPYLRDPNDLHSFDAAHPDSPYEGFRFDTDFPQDNHRLGAHTPSYNGSYQGSPYSVLSDLPTFDPADDTLGSLFTDNPSGVTISGVIPPTDEYDPSDYDYDLPTGSSFDFENFATTMNENTPSVAVTPPAFDHSSPSGLDHPSPASSNGGDDDRQSRASSASSFVHPSSPPLNEFAQNFETLRFDSPNWRTGNLPVDRTTSPIQKVQSPPQLIIPDISSPATTVHDEPPIINAPDGDGLHSGPQLHIVPATPISGGVGSSQNAPFLEGGVQGSNAWNQQHLLPQAGTGNRSLAPSNQFTDQSQHYFSGSNPSSPTMPLINPPPTEHPTSAGLGRQQFLVPQVPVARSRSLSDTSRRPPTWNTAPLAGPSSVVDTVNMNDVLPGPGSSSPSPLSNQRLVSSAGPHQTSFMPGRLAPHFSFGPLSTSMQSSQHSNDFLTPDVPGAANLRRVKSDSNRFPGFGHRQVRSEDLRFSPSLAMTTSGPNGMLIPPTSQTSQEFIRSMSHGRQFLHPNEGVLPSIASRGHHRRSSSGSRERPTGLYGPGGPSRPSPYPSPSASPRPGYTTLPGPDMDPMSSMARGMPVDMGIGGDMGLHLGGMGSGPGAQVEVPVTITKVNVTTPSTADASQKRRKQPANFVCPVPGCGSTFTRHFNLKGHLRSHAEEKPYQCKWPGCGKGFARQHDCKRHEQLHLNIRPYPCEGCKKNFARMDALNRHLRSEGGAECRKIQKEMKPGDITEADFTAAASAATSTAPGAGSPGMKHETEGWTAVGIVA